MVFATGQAVGAPLGGYLADTIGWRWYCALPSHEIDSYDLLLYLGPSSYKCH